MKSLVVILVLFSSFLVGCNTLPNSTREMWKRSGYGIKKVEKIVIPGARKQKIEKVYVGRRLLPTGYYFLRGEAAIVVSGNELIFEGMR